MVVGSPTRFVVTIRGARLARYGAVTYVASAWLNSDQADAASLTFTTYQQADSLQVRVIGTSTQAFAGANGLTLSNDTRSGETPLDLDCVDYDDGAPERERWPGRPGLRLWGDEVAGPGQQADLR